MTGARQQFVEEAYRRYWDELCRYLKSAVGNIREEPADIAQTAFARLAAVRDPQSVENPRAFLYRTARNLVIDQVRRNHVRNDYRHSRAIEACELDHADVSPEDVALQRERLEVLKRAIESMPKKRRRIFVLNRVHGLSYAEIAAQEGMKESAVTRHVFRALVDCQKVMKETFAAERRAVAWKVTR